MRVGEAERAFREFLAEGRLDPNDVAAVAAMIDWHETVRADDTVPLDEDGDMPLFQWGTYDWGQRRWFEHGITPAHRGGRGRRGHPAAVPDVEVRARTSRPEAGELYLETVG